MKATPMGQKHSEWGTYNYEYWMKHKLKDCFTLHQKSTTNKKRKKKENMFLETSNITIMHTKPFEIGRLMITVYIS